MIYHSSYITLVWFMVEAYVVQTSIHHCMVHTWWRHQMETFSALLSLCVGSSPVTGEFSAQRPVTRSLMSSSYGIHWGITVIFTNITNNTTNTNTATTTTNTTINRFLHNNRHSNLRKLVCNNSLDILHTFLHFQCIFSVSSVHHSCMCYLTERCVSCCQVLPTEDQFTT